MPVQLGTTGQPGFDEPIALMMDCHRRIERFLGMLLHVAEHGGTERLDDESQRAVRTALRYFREAAPNHTADEEQSLFPRLRELDGDDAADLLAEAHRLESQHREAERMHRRVESRFDHWMSQVSVPPDQLNDLRCDLIALRSLYQEHIAFEDDTLFPAAAQMLDEEAMNEIGREMAARRGLGLDRPSGDRR